MDAFKKTGFSSVEEFKSYSAAGFLTMDAFKKTGFLTLEKYKKYAALGFETFADLLSNGGTISTDFFKECDNKGDSYYRTRCQRQKAIWWVIAESIDEQDGIEFSVLSDVNGDKCEGTHKFTVDAPNLANNDRFKKLEGRCAAVYAVIGEENFLTPDIYVDDILMLESIEEKESRLKKKVEREEKEKAEQAQREAEELKNHRNDAEWLADRFSIIASSACRSLVESLAKYDYEWTDGWLDSKFPSYITETKAPYVLTVAGDKIKFQNGFGAWRKQKYRCDYDVKQGKALQAYVIEW